MTQDALKMALEFIENSECGTADLEALIKEALREHALKEVQRLGQEIEQPKVRTGDCLLVGVCASEGHKIAPQRPWVGLTDEEENEYNYLGPDMHWVIQEIAAKLKEKNNAA
jgi:hypothetical protein